MRRMWAARAAIVVCLVLGAAPVVAQSPSAPAPVVMATPMPVAVTGTFSGYFMSLYGVTDQRAAGGSGTPHARDAEFLGTATADDPRVSGTQSFHWNHDAWGDPDAGTLALVQWGSSRIENDGGAWEGKGSGVYSQGRGDIVALWFAGSGGYAGLGHFELLTAGAPWTIRGLMFAGDPPDLAGIPPVTGPAPSPNVPPGPTLVPRPTPTALTYGPVSVTSHTRSLRGSFLASPVRVLDAQATGPRTT